MGNSSKKSLDPLCNRRQFEDTNLKIFKLGKINDYKDVTLGGINVCDLLQLISLEIKVKLAVL